MLLILEFKFIIVSAKPSRKTSGVMKLWWCGCWRCLKSECDESWSLLVSGKVQIAQFGAD